jgi:hypothetical protein
VSSSPRIAGGRIITTITLWTRRRCAPCVAQNRNLFANWGKEQTMANYTRTPAAKAARDKRYAEALRLLKSRRGATAEEIRKTIKMKHPNLQFVVDRLAVDLVRVNDDRPARWSAAA